MIAILATVFADSDFLRAKNVTFYIDNSNYRDALVMGCNKTTLIDRMVKLFVSEIRKLNISARFAITPSDFNPPDAMTRAADLPFPVRAHSKFGILEALKLEGGCHAWRIPVTERTPPKIFHTRDTKERFFRCDSRQNGFRILGENGPKLAHLRLVSFEWIKIL